MPRYTKEQFIKDLEHGKYAFPGGYPRFFVTYDGEALSFEAATKNAHLVKSAISDNDKTGGWLVIGCEINWEDQTLLCSETNKPIEAAYGDRDKNA